MRNSSRIHAANVLMAYTRDPNATTTTVARDLGVSKCTVHSALNRLEALGYIASVHLDCRRSPRTVRVLMPMVPASTALVSRQPDAA